MDSLNKNELDELLQLVDSDSDFKIAIKIAKIIKIELIKKNIILFIHTLIYCFAMVFIFHCIFYVEISFFFIIVLSIIMMIVNKAFLKGTDLIHQITKLAILERLKIFLRKHYNKSSI